MLYLCQPTSQPASHPASRLAARMPDSWLVPRPSVLGGGGTPRRGAGCVCTNKRDPGGGRHITIQAQASRKEALYASPPPAPKGAPGRPRSTQKVPKGAPDCQTFKPSDFSNFQTFELSNFQTLRLSKFEKCFRHESILLSNFEKLIAWRFDLFWKSVNI